ncbi:MAG: hypothetical protein CVU44_04330 [Chloroflexi bacterium HGW-Chloroflexi-6]|nr:MAG: hypothetical protein CVU44_04330 [Chloroflexi bacterium HGW-Chloroflexi-6]
MSKILIVDDDQDVRDTLKWPLRDAGHEVDTAGDQAEALEQIVQHTYDFAVLDVRLFGLGEDDISGITLSIAFKKLCPAIQIILLSQYEKTKKTDRAVRYGGGIIDFIQKKHDFVEQIIKIIEGSKIEPIAGQESNTQSKSEYTRLVIDIHDDRANHIRSSGDYVVSKYITSPPKIATRDIIRQENTLSFKAPGWAIWVKGIGDQLWKEIFETTEINSAFSKAKGKSSRIAIVYETSKEKIGLPLEFIYANDDQNDYLILQHPVSRFVSGISPTRNAIDPHWLVFRKELRVLLIASNTKPVIDGVDREIDTLYQYLQTQKIIPIKVKKLATEQANYEAVQKELESESYDIVHYAGHGWYDAGNPTNSYLLFWAENNKQGSLRKMRAAELTTLLRKSSIRLFYLSSCHGAATADGTDIAINGDFLGMAEAILQAGVPSVVGFRDSVRDQSAVQIAKYFYESLLMRGRLDVALWDARCKMAANRDDPTWLLPILFNQA